MWRVRTVLRSRRRRIGIALGVVFVAVPLIGTAMAFRGTDQGGVCPAIGSSLPYGGVVIAARPVTIEGRQACIVTGAASAPIQQSDAPPSEHDGVEAGQ